MKIGIIDLIQEDLHPAPDNHPENPDRVRRALNYLFSSDLSDKIELIESDFGEIDISPLKAAHDKDYLEKIKTIANSGGGSLDMDTFVTKGSFEAALNVVRATIGSVDRLMSGAYDRILIAGRPPGHHAEYGRGAGFCLINNSAVAAQAVLENYNLNRVAIIDWDVHHGNGTQNIFYGRDDVMYISLHRYPFYPGTGSKDEQGRGKGTGYTINYPLPCGAGDSEYLDIFYNKIIPELDDYRPEFIIITSGFDAHKDDLLGGMNVSSETFEIFTKLVVDIANRHCNKKVLSFFEGGYNPEANAESLYFHIKGMQGSVEDDNKEGVLRLDE